MPAEAETEFPDSSCHQRLGTRTVLATPLLREGVAIGAIMIRRTEVRPFTDKQIKLLETFAAQAVIAIENVRLFQELEATQNAQLGAADCDERDARRHQPARRRTFSRCWMPSPRTRRGFARQPTHVIRLRRGRHDRD